MWIVKKGSYREMAAVWKFSMGDKKASASSVNKKGSEPTCQLIKISDPNVELAFGWNRMILRIVGLWPGQTCEKSQANLLMRYISPLIVIWMVGFVTIPQVLASITYNFVLDEFIELIIDIVGLIGIIARIVGIWCNGEVVMDHWTEKHTVEEHEFMIENAKLSRRLLVGVTILAMGLLGSCIFVKSVAVYYLNFGTHNGTDFGKQLLAPSYFPFDLNKPSNFAFAWIGQFFVFVFGTVAYSSVDSFIAALIIHLCGQIAILRRVLIMLIDHDTYVSSSTLRDKLAVIVKRHNNLNKLATVINDSVDLTLLVVILVYTLQLGLQLFRLYMAITEREPGQFPMVKVIFCISFLSVILVHLLGYCYIGDMLIQESEALGLATYSCEWYNLSDRTAKDLILVMHRARTPLQICAGKFVPFSLELFGNVLKTSMGYFSMILTMQERTVQ